MKLPAFVNRLRYWRWYFSGRMKIRRLIKSTIGKQPLKVNIGSAIHADSRNQWIMTDIPHFDILREADWKYFFPKPDCIDNLLAEHVFEHFTETQVHQALAIISRYMKQGGCFRIAVPDAFHVNPEYIRLVEPEPGDLNWKNHKTFWNYKNLEAALRQHNFQCEFVEYYNEQGQFVSTTFTDSRGWILRSRSRGFREGSTPDYSSLIIDAIKS